MIYAGLGVRFVALALDCGLLTLVTVSIAGGSAFFRLAGEIGVGPPMIPWDLLGAPTSLALMALVAAYWPVNEALWGATPGKWAMRLEVLRSDGSPIDFRAAIVRRLSLPPPLLLPDALVILFTERKQRAFDLLADTVVVHVR